MHSHHWRYRRTAILATLFVVSSAYFYEGGGWNQNTRFDLVRALAERGTVQIDLYHENTEDKAIKDGHVYSDKAPGASLTAVPAVVAARWLLRLAGQDLESPSVIAWLSYVATVAAAGIPAAIAGVSVFLLARRLALSDTAAGVAAVVCSLGTPLWAYGTLLYGHALAAGCLMFAVYAAWRVQTSGSPDPAESPRRQAWRPEVWAFLAALSAGWAVVTEFPASIPSALITVYAWNGLRGARSAAAGASLARGAVALAGGLSVGAAALLAYNWVAFRDLFHIGYTSEAGYEAMRTGIFGVNWPRPRVLLSLLFGPYRGLLLLAPVLALAPIGFWLLMRDARTRAVGGLACAIAAYYLLMTAGYAYWDGGWSYGSRHLGPALPFLALAVAPVWRAARRPGRVILLALAIVGVGSSLIAVSTTPQPPGGQSAPANPMRDLLWPAFASGEFPIGWQSVLELRAPAEPPSELVRRGVPRASWNLGQKIGLNGHVSLAPLLAIWALGAWLWWRSR